jgi:hypothetical protein
VFVFGFKVLLDDSQLLAHLYEGGDGFVQVLLLVGGAQLYADAGLSGKNPGITWNTLRSI